MADEKFTALSELAETPADDDLLAIVDISDTTQSAGGSTKKIKVENLLSGAGGGGGELPETTAANDFAVGNGAGAWIKKTLAETLTILGKAAASGLASLDGSSKVVQDPANATTTATASKIPIADGSAKLDTWISDASDTVKGKVELATAEETTTGTSTTKAVSPDGLAGSKLGTRGFSVQIVDPASNVDTVSGVYEWLVPEMFDGMNLKRAQAKVDTAGTTNATTIQVRNLTKHAGNDALSTAVSIASAATIGTAGTVDATYDDVSTDDVIKIYVTGQSTTKPKGLLVTLEYQLP